MQLTLSEDEAYTVEWALETARARTEAEGTRRWAVHARLAEVIDTEAPTAA